MQVLVSTGDEVKKGDKLLVYEAMKMENTLRAERNATVAKVHFEAGASLEPPEGLPESETERLAREQRRQD